MIIRPRNKVVAVDPIFPPDISKGGIYIPDQAKDRCKQGIVKYVGNEVTYCKVGDYVIFGAYTGSLIKIDDDLLIFMHEDFIEAVIEDVPSIDIPGLYLRDKDGYFQATYAMVMDMVTRGLGESSFFKNLKVQDKRPEKNYYDHSR